MLINTFLHLPNIGKIKERRLWNEGMKDWNIYLDWAETDKLPDWLNENHTREIQKSKKSLEQNDYQYFRGCLTHREFWRTFPEFRDSTVYLDIETTGLDRFHNDITIVGLYNGSKVMTYIKGKNLNELPDELRKYSSIVSFNGIMFDMPFISAKFKDIKFDQIQLDLRFILKRLGYRGGLKRIERDLGVSRTEETEGLSGYDAIRLWRQYESGNEDALNTLVKYNTEDIVNLEYLMIFAYDRLKLMTLDYNRIDG